MGRPTTKKDLLEAAGNNYNLLMEFIDSMTEKELSTPFDFEGQPSKKEAHWKRDKNLRDVLIHLYEWHQLQLSWIDANRNGEEQPFIPKPYTWRTLASMNEFFWKKHQNTSLEDAKGMLAESHEKIMKLAEEFTNDELFAKGVYKWVGSSALGSYFVSNTSSHYDWALKKLKAHRRNCK